MCVRHPHPGHESVGQCSTVSPGIGKSAVFAVASPAPTPTAAEAMRQSAWCSVMPCWENWRRHSPARIPSVTPSGARRRPRKSRSATDSSSGSRPRQISSTEMAQTHGSVPSRRRPATRAAAGRPRSASIRTVESRRSRATTHRPSDQPERRASPRRCRRTQAAGSSSHACPVSGNCPRAEVISSQRLSFSSSRRIRSAMNRLRPRGLTRRSSSATSSSSKAMCRRMCQL